MRLLLLLIFVSAPTFGVFSQIVINEGSNKNYTSIADEDDEYKDWIELYNNSTDTVSLFGYALTDDTTNLSKWTFPNISMLPNEYKTVFCSGKNRKPLAGFVSVLNQTNYSPTVGWNTHTFSTPFYWDGVSNVLVNVCSYENTGYTENAVFNQTATPFNSTLFAFQDNSDASCGAASGNTAQQRPNLQLNGLQVGNGTIQNSPTDYPAPYGNWYWSARHQMLILASELQAAGLSAGYINSLAFDVVSTNAIVYDYIDISMKMVAFSDLNSNFESLNPNNFQHTNFSLASSGETIYLIDPTQNIASNLFVNVQNVDNSNGLFPDASSNAVIFDTATPSATNNASIPYTTYLFAPVFSTNSGIFGTTVNLTISHINAPSAQIYYTLDGSEPTTASLLYTGGTIPIFYSQVVRARVFDAGFLPSSITTASYLLGISHETPILSLTTDPNNLIGPNGIFTNWQFDWKKAAYADYYDENQQLVFSQRTGMQIDGGWGGSRSHPQHSFRLELDNGTLGDGTIQANLIPNRSNRNMYSNLYFRNGSNQWLQFPYKDGYQEEAMSGTTNNYYSAWRPVSVYINGGYFGLYELREKLDDEYFRLIDGADKDSIDILSLSAWNNFALRSVYGAPVDTFVSKYIQFYFLDPASPNYWNDADQIFDLTYYADYILAESWMGNVDWPGNNIKIYRSNKTDFRYRFCTIDMELAMAPYSWSDCTFDHIDYMQSQDPNNPFINVWLKSMQNNTFHDYFINRFADVMNTEYLMSRLLPLEDDFFNQMAVEMQKEYMRWGDPNNIPGQMTDFYNAHLTFQDQLSQRTDFVRDDIQSNFSLPNQVDLTLDVHPAGAGKIHISTIEPTDYPWNGVYFNGIPIKIEAIPNPGYDFANWGNNGLISDLLDSIFLDTLNVTTIQFDAYFVQNNLGVEEETKLVSGFNLYPNPSNTSVTLVDLNTTIDRALEIEIVDFSGRIVKMVKTIEGHQQIEIGTANLPEGIYTVRISANGSGQEQLRLVVMH